jgi:hypothetical protein
MESWRSCDTFVDLLKFKEYQWNYHIHLAEIVLQYTNNIFLFILVYNHILRINFEASSKDCKNWTNIWEQFTFVAPFVDLVQIHYQFVS